MPEPRCCSEARRGRVARAVRAAVALVAVVAVGLVVVPSVGRPLAAQSPALTGAARWADTVATLVDRGVITGDTALFTAATATASRALGAFPGDPLLLHYRGYARYRMTQRLAEDAREALLESAVEDLEASAAVRPMPETYVLLSSARGMLIGGSMLRGMRLGPAANAAEDRATALGPRNPRVLLMRAIGAWFKPAMWGGGEDKGHALLLEALRAYATDTVASPLPRWGHAEAYAWLGQMEAKRGRTAEARDAYRQALALEPGFAWVRDGLLPSLERTR